LGKGNIVKINQLKGNSAEAFVMYQLMKNGIPAWQVGGNNPKWDLIVSLNDKLKNASVKFAKTRKPIYTKKDEKLSDGLYFVVVPEDKRDLRKNFKLLLFTSSKVSTSVIKYRKRARNNASWRVRKNFRNMSITLDVEKLGETGWNKLVRKFGKDIF
jgi:hypothetical protein